ncbi:hypothetical protein GF412_04610 [Candidatus Micrarchaeota archaeon]|nr:hypothetical protein [Candidatus Micrarchaeota archaeon]MBD3418234.1 hypothetical protein [Candidatus Micrarchaeota archaeon]
MDIKYALFALMVFGLAFAGLSISDYALSPEVVEPGTSGFLQITVSNSAQTDTVENVVVEISSVEDLGIDRSFVVGDLEAMSSVMVSLPFSAAEDIPSGYYTVEAKATGRTKEYYLDSSNQLKSKTETFTKRATIPVEVVEQPVISVFLSEESVEDITQEILTFTNEGGTAKRMKVTILNEGMGFLNQDQLYLKELEDSAMLNATLDARGSDEGAAKLQLQLAYQNELGTEITETKEIPVTVKKGEGNFVFVQGEPVVTGEEEDLQLTLTNEGNAISDLRFTFQTDDVRLQGLNEFKVGDLGKDETISLSVPLVADLEPGTKNVALDLTWEESGEDRMGTVTIPVKVISDSSVGVYLEANPAPLTSGNEHTLSVTVSNLGSYDIEGTTVEVSSEALELLTVQPQQYIGGLESDDFSSVQYKVRVKQLGPGNYPASVTVMFRDASGEWITVEKEMEIAISEPVSEGDSPLPLAIGVVAIAAIAYWWFRKRKEK